MSDCLIRFKAHPAVAYRTEFSSIGSKRPEAMPHFELNCVGSEKPFLQLLDRYDVSSHRRCCDQSGAVFVREK
jgi:hypothetical protein